MTSTDLPHRPRAAGLLLGGVLTGILLASGSLGLWTLLAAPEPLRTEAQEQVYHPPVTDIDIDLDYSSVTLVGGKPGAVTVRRQLTWSRAKPVPEEKVVGRTLQIRSQCPRTLLPAQQCGVDLVVEVPPGAAARVNVYSGQVHAEDLTGAAHLNTVNGDITVTGIRGRLWARSERGAITGTGLSGAETDAKTLTGDVELRFATIPQLVQAVTTRGDVSVAVPRAGAGVEGFQIRAGTGDGLQDVEVPHESAARNTIVARTDHGNVSVRYTIGS